MHWNFVNDDSTVTVNLLQNDNGGVWGTVTYMGTEYPVTGLWQAANSVTGRNTSNLYLSGHYDTAPDVPDFISLCGLIKGTNPNMGPMDVVVQSVSSATGNVFHTTAHLANTPGQPQPATVAVPPIGGTNIPWAFCSLDGSTLLEVQVGGDGTITGKLTRNDDGDYSVHGQWVASGFAPGRNATVFELTGKHAVVPGASNLLALAGVVTGPYQAPQKIDVSGGTASISEWTNSEFRQTLLPMMTTDATSLAAAYAESYMVIRMGGTGGDSQAMQGWIGPTDASQNVTAFGSADYKTAGTTMSAEQLASIASPDPNHGDTNDIRIPAFQSAADVRPVMIQFVGDLDHFAQPPLSEYHEDITGVFYDDQADALVLQFADRPRGTPSSPINFNHGHGHHSGRNHLSVIIEPR